MNMTSFFVLVITAFASLAASFQQFGVPVTVTINPIYNLILEVDVITEHVAAGGNLIVLVKLNKTGPANWITVDLDYSILNMKKQVVATGDAGTIDVIDETEKNVTIPLPSYFTPGRYILNITASHPQAKEVSDYDYFWVSKKSGKGLLEYLSELFKYAKIVS